MKRAIVVAALLATLSAPAAAQDSFGDGIHMVGTDIAAGTYRAPGGDGCHWARLAGLGGTVDEVIASGAPAGSILIAISHEDAGFETSGCGEWIALELAPAPEPVTQVFRDSFAGAPDLEGRVADGIVVLTDRSYCAFILGGTFGSGRYISADVLRWELQDNGFNRRAVNNAIRRYAQSPITNDLLLDACTHNLTQFLHPDVSFFEVLYPDDPDAAEAPQPPEWQAQPVMPESLHRFLVEE